MTESEVDLLEFAMTEPEFVVAGVLVEVAAGAAEALVDVRSHSGREE